MFETEALIHSNQEEFFQYLGSLSPLFSQKFLKIARGYLLFHMLFALFFVIEVITFCFFLTSQPKSISLAVCLAALLLTIFAYFVLLYYFQGQKPEQFTKLRDRFLAACEEMLTQVENSDYYLLLANASHRFSTQLQTKEFSPLPFFAAA